VRRVMLSEHCGLSSHDGFKLPSWQALDLKHL
jgi:hypothetical protein